MADMPYTDAPATEVVRLLRGDGAREQIVNQAIREAVGLYRQDMARDPSLKNREYGTAILECSTPDGTAYRYEIPNTTGRDGAWEAKVKLLRGCKIDSLVHTHPTETHSYAGPSRNDDSVAKSLKVDSYIASPSEDASQEPRVHRVDAQGRTWENGRVVSKLRR